MQEAGMFFEVAAMSTDPSRVVNLELVAPRGPGPVLYVTADWSTEAPPDNMFTVPIKHLPTWPNYSTYYSRSQCVPYPFQHKSDVPDTLSSIMIHLTFCLPMYATINLF